jgi:two-component system NtrC family sensor kinase
MTILEKMPTVVTVAVLVGIFAGLKRHGRSARLQLWLVAWSLVFVHFVAQMLEPASGPVSKVLQAIDIATLIASAAIFVVSVSSVVEDRYKRNLFLLTTLIPAVAYGVLDCYDLSARWPFVLCLLFSLGGGSLFLFWAARNPRPWGIVTVSITSAAGVWATQAALHGSFDEGLTVLLGLGFALPGIFVCWNYWRVSPGTLTVVVGFLSWGAVFPVGMLMERFAPGVNVPPELWNVPKMFVAFGMILAMVEDKSESIEAMQRRERVLNRQMERFSAITSQLLSGANVDALCAEITLAITEVSNFRVAAIHLDNAGQGLRLAGASGLGPLALTELESKARAWTPEDVKDFCSRGRRIGKNSFLLSAVQAAKYGPVKSQLTYGVNPHWNSGDELLIPLASVRGGCLGCIALDDPREPEEVNAEHLSRIELLAADLAVALELKSLQRQLVRSEKLAALGQLVAGVAHELNNPLTAVMGYGELLGDDIAPGPVRDRLDKLVTESRRMKKIVENLLRFSRQSTLERRTIHLLTLVQDVLALREYHLRTQNVEVLVDISPEFPQVVADEDQCKQVLLNLFNNAIDAVEGCAGPKRITIRAVQKGDRASIVMEDTGPGFSDLNRAFDPFYTTKPVGRGTGLGLSICHGIVKEHGGEIRLENMQPNGARVTVDLPMQEGSYSKTGRKALWGVSRPPVPLVSSQTSAPGTNTTARS